MSGHSGVRHAMSGGSPRCIKRDANDNALGHEKRCVVPRPAGSAVMAPPYPPAGEVTCVTAGGVVMPSSTHTHPRRGDCVCYGWRGGDARRLLRSSGRDCLLHGVPEDVRLPPGHTEGEPATAEGRAVPGESWL